MRRSCSALCSGHGLSSTGQSLWTEPIMDDLLPVHLQPGSPYLPSFQLGTPHTSPDPLDDDAPLQFRHGRHDDDYGSAERTLRVNCLTLREELNTEPRKFIQRLEQM